MKKLKTGVRSRIGVLLLIVTAGLLSAALQAEASVIIYPSTAPCNSTLQACIDAAGSGDVIETDAGYLDESISIDKSLTLMPVPGRTFVAFGGGVTPRSVYITNGPNGETVNVVLQQLLIDPGYVHVGFYQGTGHSVTIRQSTITANMTSTGTRGIDLDVRTAAVIKIEENLIQSFGYPIYLLTLGNPGDSISLNVVGNRIFGANSSFSSQGIDLDLRGSGSVQATVLSNVIWGVAYCNCGNPAAIGISSSDSVQSYIRVGNNTIDQSGGIGIMDAGASGTSTQQLYVNNNIVTHCSSGMWLPAFDSDVYISHNYNDYFGNTGANNYGGYQPGPQTYNFDPLNADQGFGYYVLQPNSPAIDLGNASAPAGVSQYDSFLRPRLLGFNVDLGAIETVQVPNNNYLLLAEEFGTLQLPPDFTYVKGAWMVDAYSLIAPAGEKSMMLGTPGFGGCTYCRIETTLRTGGTSKTSMWIRGWYTDKKNQVELIVKEGSDKLILRQKLNGKVVNKTAVKVTLEPFTPYAFRLLYDGLNFLVYVDGTQVMTLPASGLPFGTFGFQAKGSYAYFENVYIY